MTTPSKAAMDAANPWECFQDPSYYDMWCVRPVHDRTFGQGFHLLRGEEAEALTAVLNDQASREAALLEALEEFLAGADAGIVYVATDRKARQAISAAKERK
jgi:hypothetical protein